MLESEFEAIEEWFRAYVRGYAYESPSDRSNVELKKEHTWRVTANMARLSGDVSVRHDPLLARAIAVLHDTGRFPQYDRYRTFWDARSVNHGELGAGVLAGSGVLKGLASRERGIVLTSVRYHNAFGLPRTGVSAPVYLKLIRDADKLDVWRVLADNYELAPDARADAVGQGLTESGLCSPEVLGRLASGRVVPLSRLKGMDDMRLMQLSWVYDLNFPASCSLALEQGDIKRIASSLPDMPEVRRAVGRAISHLEKRAQVHLEANQGAG